MGKIEYLIAVTYGSNLFKSHVIQIKIIGFIGKKSHWMVTQLSTWSSNKWEPMIPPTRTEHQRAHFCERAGFS